MVLFLIEELNNEIVKSSVEEPWGEDHDLLLSFRNYSKPP